MSTRYRRHHRAKRERFYEHEATTVEDTDTAAMAIVEDAAQSSPIRAAEW
jgi:hypothetical protein